MATPKKPPQLDTLPPELLSQIISHAPSATFLRNLSLTNRPLHTLVTSNGWTAFVNARFPSIPTPPHWRSAAHALTTLSRNFDRKAFIAQDAGPDFGKGRTRISVLPGGRVVDRWERSGGQTMGYQPVVDSAEVWTGGGWEGRREVVAWGAGAEVVVKIEERGSKQVAKGAKRTWLVYRDPGCREGLHDVTALKILGHEGSDAGASLSVNLMIGRATGGMELIELSEEGVEIKRNYECGDANVQCADVSSGSSLLLAACLDDSTIALYNVNGSEPSIPSFSEVQSISPKDKGSRCWSSTFVSPHRLAVGRGISTKIVQVYDVRPDGLSQEPVRAFSSALSDQGARNTSAYPIVSVPKSTQSQDGDGDLMFSGGYDGIIRLHDMRSPRDCVGTISDLVDNSAIFSLATVGRERVIAGAAAHGLLKVFDLRMPGGRAYSYLDASGKEPRVPLANEIDDGEELVLQASGSNIYTPRTGPGHRQRNRRWGQDSPVYSLSRPSASSPKLYVGLENHVLDLNFTSAADPYPDPAFKSSLLHDNAGNFDSRQTWNRGNQVMALSMYEQSGRKETKLVYQKDISNGMVQADKSLKGYDERWHVVQNMRATAVLGGRNQGFSNHRLR